ncbi:YeeE/YedE family protein [bacterium]|nr:YeeE/YedE family protein [bacterium]
MSDQNKGAWRQLWSTFFGKTWPMWVGGILLGAFNVFLFLIKSPWGGSGTYISWGQNLFRLIGILGMDHTTVLTRNLYGVLGTMTVFGAFLGAMLSKEFAIRVPPAGEMLKGFLGGCFMAIGCTVGKGCTIGGYLSGLPALSAGAIPLAIGFGIGSWLALHYLLWEMEKLPKMSSGKSVTWLAAKGKGGAWQPIVGVIIAAFLLIGGSLFFKGDRVFTWFAIMGLILGLISQRSRFCVTRSFREPFMTGDSEAPVAVLAALLVGLLGFTIIKYMGIGAMHPLGERGVALTWVNPNFWLNGLVGGTIFGIGMVIAGGCAVGTLWRMGEGQIKLWFAGLGFALLAPISSKWIAPAFLNILPEWMHMPVFLPDYFKYWGAVLILLVIMVLWYVFVKWNERTGKFSAL